MKNRLALIFSLDCLYDYGFKMGQCLRLVLSSSIIYNGIHISTKRKRMAKIRSEISSSAVIEEDKCLPY